MSDLLPLIPALPFAGFLALSCFGSRIPRTLVAALGTGTIGLSSLCSILTFVSFIVTPPAGHGWTKIYWTWFRTEGLAPSIGFYVDSLSLVMTVVITVVGFLIHLYSVGFMAHEEGYSRFFAYMNLFVGSMVVLVLADNLLLLYLGWEGVGLCSYLLIGFWYRDQENGRAAVKAFIVTRVGDAAMAVGIFLIYTSLKTMAIQDVLQGAVREWLAGSGLAVAVSALFLAGAAGKSAQLPLQTWLPDAMAGPTPVSALIHAATMVTAGVYLIARTHTLFILAPSVQSLVATIGAVTLLIGATSALCQQDIKRILAYSTMSQVGYMFLALGVGAWSAAIFHFITHAFFKALLFLSAGVVIQALKGEHDIFKMGGLKRSLPLAFWTFLIGAASLSAVPLVTAGFYSKDLILLDVFASTDGSLWLWGAGLAGAFLTSLYTFRMIFRVFFGAPGGSVSRASPGSVITVPLVILAFLSTVIGFIELPGALGGLKIFSPFIDTSLPPLHSAQGMAIPEGVLLTMASAVSLLGIYLAYHLFLRGSDVGMILENPSVKSVSRFWLSGWGFDGLYERCFVGPFVEIARVNKNDVVDLVFKAFAKTGMLASRLLVYTQTGKVRYYGAAILLGAIVCLAMVLLL